MTDHFRILQPFFSFDVMDYRERSIYVPFQAKFYQFRTKQIIDRSNEEYFMVCIPDGCLDIVFIQKDGIIRIELIGTPVERKQLIVYPDAEYFGVRMQPGLILPNAEISLREAADTEIFLPQLSPDYRELSEKIFAAQDFASRVRLFEKFFLADGNRDISVQGAVSSTLLLLNKSQGGMTVAGLADELGYSTRHVSRMFSDALGYSPKQYACIVRFQCALETLIDHPEYSVSQYMGLLGYSDQAHFQRECKSFTGLTPKQIAKYCRRYLCKGGEPLA